LHYTIYKITHRSSGKIYIGKHQTNNLDDGYMGSGKILKRAVEKYGIEEFEKEILFDLNSEEEMNTMEAELVTEEFCSRNDTYNLCPGGHGGWGYVNSNGKSVNYITKDNSLELAKLSKDRKEFLSKTDPEWKRKYSENHSKAQVKRQKTHGNGFKNKSHSDEWKLRQSEVMKLRQSGKNNSQFGSMWITNGTENKKISKLDIIPEGWYKGRKMK